MKILREYTETLDGVDYEVTEYERSNGEKTIVREIANEPTEPEPIDEPIDTEILLCETLSVAEYNSCLLEMMM